MKEIQIEELRELQMQILDYIDPFCRSCGINYTISGGTLLGAVRHGVYIPWDDDIDIQMLRDDYVRFTQLWNEKREHGYYELVNIESGNNMGYPFGKVHDKRTITYVGGVARTGVYIDVFPVDKVIDEDDFIKRHKAVKQLYKKQFWAFALKRDDFKQQNFIIRLFLKLFYSWKTREQYAVEINRLAQKNNSTTSPYVYEMIAGQKCKRPMSTDVFKTFVDIKFENREYMAVSDYDTYLTATFGNYMQLPPKEQQVRTHDFVAYWL